MAIMGPTRLGNELTVKNRKQKVPALMGFTVQEQLAFEHVIIKMVSVINTEVRGCHRVCSRIERRENLIESPNRESI